MKKILSLFWWKTWDNIFHVVIINMTWLALTVPFLLATRATLETLFPAVDVPNAPASAAGAAQESSETSEPPGPFPMAPAGQSTEAVSAAAPGQAQAAIESTGATAHKARFFRWSIAGVPAIIFLAASWLLFCIATGFVFYAMADIVAGHDFSGYRVVFRDFLKRAPIVASIALITLFVAAFLATWTNLSFYLRMAGTKGIILLFLAGIMLWFLIFITMTFMYALPIAAQRRTRVVPAMKTGAMLALTYPGRGLLVLALAAAVFVGAVVTGVGAGFFAMAAPACLFNAAAKLTLEQFEAKRRPGAEAPD